MRAGGLWTGLAASPLLSEPTSSERNFGRLLVTLVGGLFVGLLAGLACAVAIIALTSLVLGDFGLGLAGLVNASRLLIDPAPSPPTLSVLKILFATTVDAASLIAFVAFAARIAGRRFLEYVSSAGRVRWRLLLVSFLLASVVIAPVVMMERVFGHEHTPMPILAVSPRLNDRLIYLLSSLSLIPAAAAEELLFRTWLLRQAGAFIRRPLFLMLFTAVLFSAAHGDFNPASFLTRAIMGVGFAYMTLRLGGIEFSTGVHTVNNLALVVFLQPLSFQPRSDAQVSPTSSLEDLLLLGSYILMAEMVFRTPILRRAASLTGEAYPA